jgi:hypothetical protein
MHKREQRHPATLWSGFFILLAVMTAATYVALIADAVPYPVAVVCLYLGFTVALAETCHRHNGPRRPRW